MELAGIKLASHLSYLSCWSCLASLGPGSKEKCPKNGISVTYFPPPGSPAQFVFKNHGPPSYMYLSKWTMTKSNLERQWPLRGTSPSIPLQ